MINKLSAILSEQLSSRQKSTSDEKEIYAYSIEVLLSLVINLIILSITASILHKIPELIIFIMFFSGLRTFAGGYHAKTHIECMTISFIIFIVSSMSSTWLVSIGKAVLIIGILISIMLVFIYAPTDSENKPLNNNEKIKFRMISRGIVILFSFIIVFLYISRAQTHNIYLTAVVAMQFESLSLLRLFNKQHVEYPA